MIDAARFEADLEVWLDGELPPAAAAGMEAYCAAHPDAKARADAERAFDLRVRQALRTAETAGSTSGRDSVMAALAKARGAAAEVRPAAAPRPGRVIPFPKWRAGAAAAALFAVAAMWTNCIPPFECPYVQALEAAASAPADGSAELDGETRERVAVAIRTPFADEPPAHALRSRVPVAGGEAVLLLSDVPGHLPSFRRERRIGGETWWIATENGRTLVAFEDPGNRGLWCFVGAKDEATLLGAARKLRTELSARPK